jgi:hypothetical protein
LPAQGKKVDHPLSQEGIKQCQEFSSAAIQSNVSASPKQGRSHAVVLTVPADGVGGADQHEAELIDGISSKPIWPT